MDYLENKKKELKNHLEGLTTYTSKHRYITSVMDEIANKSRSFSPKSDEYKKYWLAVRELDSMKSDILTKAVNEMMHDPLVKAVNETLLKKNFAELKSLSNAENAYWKGLKLWNSENSADAPRLFEKAGLLNLAAEAFGRNGDYDEELRLHRIIKSKGESMKEGEAKFLEMINKSNVPLKSIH